MVSAVRLITGAGGWVSGMSWVCRGGRVIRVHMTKTDRRSVVHNL